MGTPAQAINKMVAEDRREDSVLRIVSDEISGMKSVRRKIQERTAIQTWNSEVKAALQPAAARLLVAGAISRLRATARISAIAYLAPHHPADDFVFLGKLTCFELRVELSPVFEHFKTAITEWNQFEGLYSLLAGNQ
jgi:hypothetical protein